LFVTCKCAFLGGDVTRTYVPVSV